MLNKMVDCLFRNSHSSRAEVVAEGEKAFVNLSEKRFGGMLVQTKGCQDLLHHHDGAVISGRRVCIACGLISPC
jgi:hypothetical protein